MTSNGAGMPDETRIANASGQDALIDAAWRQVIAIPKPEPDSLVGRLAAAARAMPKLPADAFPGYTIVDEIHRGGQGVVYRAMQASTQREVAIKVLRDSHLRTESDVARFELEVRVLARLRHPHIVRIFDSQVVDGHFYYAMDYIAGLPLDHYVRDQRPDLRTIVATFAKICDAVHVAHLHGVIHRDLKPGNIRVDAAGEPLLLDFGLSKLISGNGNEFTQTGQFVGSLPWASPEQVDGQADNVDLRTDVYSLGVLLYQMLTWRFPYTVTGAPSDVLLQIRFADPTPPRRHIPSLPADLETIVLKCLQKDPQRRYQSAGELARDLRRFYDGEPIEARGDSLTYLLTKQLARYKYVAMGSAVLIVALLGGFLTSLSFWRQAEAARRTEQRARQEAMRSAEEAQSQAKLAAMESAKSVAVSDFLTEMLTSVNPYEGGALDIRVVDTLETAARRLDRGALADQPDRDGAVRRVLGIAYAAMGHFEPAEQQLRAALERLTQGEGAAAPQTIETAINLGGLLRERATHDESEHVLRKAIDDGRRYLGPRHALVAKGLNELGSLLRDLGQLDEAEASFREALSIRRERFGDRHPDTVRTLNDLALLLNARGAEDEARKMLEQAINTGREVHGAEHPTLASMMSNLASILTERAEYPEAERLYVEALEIMRASFGPRHPTVARGIANLASLYRVEQRYTEALSMLEEALKIQRALLGNEHPTVAGTLNNIAATAHSLGRYDLAAENLGEAAEILTAVYGPDHDDVLTVRSNLAALQYKRGDLAAAEKTIRDVHEAHIRRYGADHPRSLQSLGNLAAVLSEQKRWEESALALQEVIDGQLSRFDRANPNVAIYLEKLAFVRANQGLLDQAEAMTREALDSYLASDRDADVARALAQLADINGNQRCTEQAAFLFARGMAVAQETLPAGHPDLAIRRFRFGQMLFKLGQVDDAIREMTESLPIFEAKLTPTHFYVIQAHEALADLYDEIGETELADAWRSVDKK